MVTSSSPPWSSSTRVRRAWMQTLGETGEWSIKCWPVLDMNTLLSVSRSARSATFSLTFLSISKFQMKSCKDETNDNTWRNRGHSHIQTRCMWTYGYTHTQGTIYHADFITLDYVNSSVTNLQILSGRSLPSLMFTFPTLALFTLFIFLLTFLSASKICRRNLVVPEMDTEGDNTNCVEVVGKNVPNCDEKMSDVIFQRITRERMAKVEIWRKFVMILSLSSRNISIVYWYNI